MSANTILDDLRRGEAPIPLSRLSRQPFVPRKKGRKLHHSAAYRWAKGLRGNRLETICCPTLCTTRSAVLRFFAHLSGEDCAPPNQSVAKVQQAISRAESALAKDGIE